MLPSMANLGIPPMQEEERLSSQGVLPSPARTRDYHQSMLGESMPRHHDAKEYSPASTPHLRLRDPSSLGLAGHCLLKDERRVTFVFEC